MVQAIAAPSAKHSRHLGAEDFSSRALSRPCGQARILEISQCACYLGSHGATLSDVVEQACGEAFGEDYTSPSQDLNKVCKNFKNMAGSFNVSAEMKIVYNAASDCISLMAPEHLGLYSYRPIVVAGKTGQVVLRHPATRAFWVPAVVVVALLAYSADAH